MPEQIVQITIVGKDQATGTLKKVDKSLKDLDGTAKKTKSSFAGLLGSTGLGRLASGGIAAGIAVIGVKALKAASDLEELNSKAKFTFREIFPQVEARAKAIAEEVGRADSAILQFSTDMGAVIDAMGLSGDALGEVSTELAKLSVDMASFHNASDADAFIALRSGIVGETEAMKKFGVVMTQTNLEAFALNHGIKTQIQNMNQAQLTALRYSFIMDATKTVQGDAARTAGSVANQLRRLGGNAKEALEELGKPTIPIAAKALEILNHNLENNVKLFKAVAGAISVAFGELKKWSVLAAQAVGFEGIGQQDFRAGSLKSLKQDLSLEDVKNPTDKLKSFNREAKETGEVAGRTDKELQQWMKDLEKMGGSGGATGKAGESVEELRENLSDLQDAFMDARTGIVDDIKQLEFAHEEAMDSLKDQLQGVVDSLAELEEQHTKTMNSLTEDRSDKIAGQFQKIVDLENKLKDIRAQNGSLSNSEVGNVINNRMDKDRESLSARDIQTFGLSRDAVEQINSVMELRREQEAFNAALSKTIVLTKEQKEGLDINFTSTASSILEKEFSGGLKRSQTSPLLLDIDKMQEQFDEEQKRFKSRKANLDTEQTKIKEKISIEEEAFTRQRQSLENTKVALEGFHSTYVEKLNDANGVTAKVVEDMKKKLEELKITISQIDALMQAKAAITGGGTVASRVAERRDDRGGLDFAARAKGGRVDEDVTLVGEFGPELVSLPRGSFVHTADQTSKMGGVTIQMGGVTVREEADENRLVQKLARLIQLQQLAA